MFDSAYGYFRYVFKVAALETVRWSGPVAIGLIIGFFITLLEIEEGSPTIPHLVRDYIGVILLIYILQLGRAFWLTHQKSNFCAEDIWELKQELREIKRCHPENAFVKFPTHRIAWSPLIEELAAGLQGIELEQAKAWHNKFSRLLPSAEGMSWEDTFEFLDREERKRRGLPI